MHCMNNGTIYRNCGDAQDVGLVNVWVRGLIYLRANSSGGAHAQPVVQATGTFDLELTGEFDDFVPPMTETTRTRS